MKDFQWFFMKLILWVYRHFLQTYTVQVVIFREFGGYLVEDSTEGILQGMYDFADGKIKPMNIDYIKKKCGNKKKTGRNFIIKSTA